MGIHKKGRLTLGMIHLHLGQVIYASLQWQSYSKGIFSISSKIHLWIQLWLLNSQNLHDTHSTMNVFIIFIFLIIFKLNLLHLECACMCVCSVWVRGCHCSQSTASGVGSLLPQGFEGSNVRPLAWQRVLIESTPSQQPCKVPSYREVS